MANPFGLYSPSVSLALTWVEQFTLYQDVAETLPVNLTGLAVRAQLRVAVPVIANSVTPTPVLELTTAGYYGATPPQVPVPTWPVIAAFTVPTPINGTINLNTTKSQYAAIVSATNLKAQYYWEVVICNPTTLDYEAVIKGRVTFLPAVTL